MEDPHASTKTHTVDIEEEHPMRNIMRIFVSQWAKHLYDRTAQRDGNPFPLQTKIKRSWARTLHLDSQDVTLCQDGCLRSGDTLLVRINPHM